MSKRAESSRSPMCSDQPGFLCESKQRFVERIMALVVQCSHCDQQAFEDPHWDRAAKSLAPKTMRITWSAGEWVSSFLQVVKFGNTLCLGSLQVVWKCARLKKWRATIANKRSGCSLAPFGFVLWFYMLQYMLLCCGEDFGFSCLLGGLRLSHKALELFLSRASQGRHRISWSSSYNVTRLSGQGEIHILAKLNHPHLVRRNRVPVR